MVESELESVTATGFIRKAFVQRAGNPSYPFGGRLVLKCFPSFNLKISLI